MVDKPGPSASPGLERLIHDELTPLLQPDQVDEAIRIYENEFSNNDDFPVVKYAARLNVELALDDATTRQLLRRLILKVYEK